MPKMLSAHTEAERIRAEAEKAKAENQKKEIEKDRKEVRRVKTEDNREKEIKPVSIGKISEQPVDINFCDEQELSLVPGIGIILAKKAIRIRNEKGNFESVDDFVKCIGIRESNAASIKSHLICTAENNCNTVDIVRKAGRKIDI